MTPFTSLLVATDLSAAGHHAVRRAALLAQAHRARLHLLHMLETPRCRALRQRLFPTKGADLAAAHALGALHRLAAEVAGTCGATPTVEVVAGDPVQALRRAAEHADLVVLGHRGHAGRGAPWFASALCRMVRACPRPVLVVKTPVAQRYARVLVPIDFTSGADAALRAAARVQREAGVHVLHTLDGRREAVLRDADVPEHVIRETCLREEAGTRARMRRRVAALGLDGTRTSLAVARGSALRTTLRHARQIRADLVVAVKPVRPTVADLLLGSLGSALLPQTACDLLIVPAPRNEAPPRTQATPVRWIHHQARFMPRRSS